MTTFTTEDRILAEKDGSFTVNVEPIPFAGMVTLTEPSQEIKLPEDKDGEGVNRKADWQIEQDTMNQSNAKTQLMQFLDVDIETQDNFSIWDWEFYRDGELLAIGEYRRRFNKAKDYPDFIFSKKKFDILEDKGKKLGVPCLFFVEFDDIFQYFPVSGNYPTRTVRRRHEVREEECVCIPHDSFLYVNGLSI